MSVCLAVFLVSEGQKRLLGPMGLQFHRVVSHIVGARNGTWVLCKTGQGSEFRDTLQLLLGFFFFHSIAQAKKQGLESCGSSGAACGSRTPGYPVSLLLQEESQPKRFCLSPGSVKVLLQ